MKTLVSWLIAVAAMTLLGETAFAKKIPKERVKFEVAPTIEISLPPDLVGKTAGLQRAAAAADTFVLHTEDFNDGTMSPYVATDFTAQLGTFFHVADATELDGGDFGNLNPLAGTKSMWCGVAPSSDAPFCGWSTLPGYGNNWVQMLQSSPLGGDSVVVSYKIFWDSEPGYDHTIVEWSHNGGASWTRLPVTPTGSNGTNLYDGTGPAPYFTESVGDRQTGGNGNVVVRFRFESDAAWSDEDGLWQTDGAVIVDDITLTARLGSALIATDTETFEGAAVGSNTAGIWTGIPRPAFGSYAALYPGLALLQEDPCFRVAGFVVAFFVDPSVANYICHTPNPRPDVGVVPYGTADGTYMNNEIVSPMFSNAGYGNEYRLEFLVYRDLPLDNLIFFNWHVRSWTAGCPGVWRNDNLVYFGPNRDWLRTSFSVGSIVNPSADGFQISVGAIDMCPVWCGIFGCGGCCHSHSPLIDDIRVIRVGVSSPQYNVRHIDGLFQDNVAEDGTILNGTARSDAAMDILPSSSVNAIVPGDSVSLVITPVANMGAGQGRNADIYVSVMRKAGRPALSGAVLGSSTVRTAPLPVAYGTRWPFTGTEVVSDITWSKFKMDTTYTSLGAPVLNRLCVDLNDNLFQPGDTIFYFYAADNDNTPGNGNEGYFTRSINGQGANTVYTDIASAAGSPLEFTILPAGGFNAGGDILYVDDQDDRGGPGQLHFDSAFDMLGILDLVDRYDVLGPSSNVDNSLASRVTDNAAQIVNVYQKILWDSGNLTSGLLGNSTGVEKSNDWGLIFTFLNTGNLSSGPGLYLSGDDMAQEWVTLSGAGAIQSRSNYMNFNKLNDSHIAHGESISPVMTATGASFFHAGDPDELVAYGGCALINDFDVLDPTGTSIIEFPYPVSGDGAIISSQTTNTNSKTATVVLSGFSYTFTRDAAATFPPARVEFMRDLLQKMGNITPNATGVDPGDAPLYANALHNNYPNPFNPTTTIAYTVKERGHVSLKVYNAAGQLVRTLVDDVQAPRPEGFSVEWDGQSDAGTAVASGVYFYRMVTKNFELTKKMVVLK